RRKAPASGSRWTWRAERFRVSAPSIGNTQSMASETRTASRKARPASRRSRTPARWVDRLQDKLPRRAQRVLDRARGQDILLFASGLAFYALISVVPLAIFVIWVTSLIVGDHRIHDIANQLKREATKKVEVGGLVA